MSQDGTLEEPGRLAIILISDSSIFINGKTFNNVDEMPPQVREVYEQVVRDAGLGAKERELNNFPVSIAQKLQMK